MALLLSCVSALALAHGGRAPLAKPLVARPAAVGPRAPQPQLSLSLIDAGVSAVTFAPQPLWLLLIAAPDAAITKTLMRPLYPIVALSLVHLTVVALAASTQDGTAPITIFADVFDPAQSQLDGMERLFGYRNFVAEEWPHVLIWDLFVGRYIWLDAQRRGVGWSGFALTLTNLIGPPGLLLYCLTCVLQGLPLPGSVGEE